MYDHTMKQMIYSCAIIAMVLLLGACEKMELRPHATITLAPEVIIPATLSNTVVTNDTITFLNLSTGHTLKRSAAETIDVDHGLYHCTYHADVAYDEEGKRTMGILKTTLENVEIDGEMSTLRFEPFLIKSQDDFIIEEIFFTGTLRASGRQYYGDSYVKIFNNTDKVLYADGITLLESKFLNVSRYNYTPDIKNDTMTVHAIYRIPGSGKEHPVQPGESLILCDTGIDHRAANPNSVDHSACDFEWYDISTAPSHMDIDSETVPNLDKWYCYTLSFFVLHNRGFRSYALARIPEEITREQYLKDYLYWYEYDIVCAAGTFPMTQSSYKIPNDWIVDGVNCAVQAEWEWNILPPSIDGGWTHCGTTDHDKTRYFKSIRRKLLYVEPDGRRVLKDTNNSTEDFNGECVPSVIEQQHSSINAQGDKATQITYDGVNPVKNQ